MAWHGSSGPRPSSRTTCMYAEACRLTRGGPSRGQPAAALSLLLCARAPLCARIMMQQVKPDDPWWGSLQQPLKPAAAVADRGGKGSGGVGLLGSMANLANAAIGAGVLAFPSIYQKAGLKLGPVLTILFALILGFTLHVISQVCADPSNVPCAQGDR
jgi:hypothetical protein